MASEGSFLSADLISLLNVLFTCSFINYLFFCIVFSLVVDVIEIWRY